MPAIVSYKVGVTRSHREGPVRWLTLKLDGDSDGPSLVSLFFFERQPPGLGYYNRPTNTVVINLPIADFEPTYHILNIEKPVYFFYRLQGSEDRLLSFDVSTSEEPVGEGPSDSSP